LLLLDTDIMIDVLRGYDPALEWLREVPLSSICLPGFVVMELLQGCSNKGEQDVLQRELQPVQVVWPQPETCDRALRQFSFLHLSHGTGVLDMLIGALAVELNLPLHTFNTKHYRAIPGLELIQPYERS
jgi:predicted nucleic acid-binding protein